MAIHTNWRMTCDRCKRLIAEGTDHADADAASNRAADEPSLMIMESTLAGFQYVNFHDLCDGCKRRLITLVKQIALSDGAEDDKSVTLGDTNADGLAGTTEQAANDPT